jgi:hypothetical protein
MYKMTDEVIGQIGKLVQLAIITGTDIVDNLRMIELTQSESDSEKLTLTPEYRAVGESQIKSLLEELEQLDSPVKENEVEV